MISLKRIAADSQPLPETLFATNGVTVIRMSHERELADAALQKVISCQRSNRRIINTDARDLDNRRHAAHVNQRTFQRP